MNIINYRILNRTLKQCYVYNRHLNFSEISSNSIFQRSISSTTTNLNKFNNQQNKYNNNKNNNKRINRNITEKSNKIETEQQQNVDEDAPIDMENPFKKEQQLCILCKMNLSPNYKNVRLLSQFQSPYTGRIYGRHITGLCKHKQALVEGEIVKAQMSGYMSIYNKNVQYHKDPPLFNPERPIRPHKY